MDFRNVTRLFADPDFDGEPVSIIDDNGTDNGEGQPENPDTPSDTDNSDGSGLPENGGGFVPPVDGEVKKKIRVRGVEIRVLSEPGCKSWTKNRRF